MVPRARFIWVSFLTVGIIDGHGSNGLIAMRVNDPIDDCLTAGR